MDDILHYIYLIPAVLIAITLHEFAHGFVSWKLGDPTPKEEGRLTLNPIKHLDPIGALCLLVFHMGWAKPVMINPNYYKNPKAGTVLVSLAGPVMNFIISIVSMLVMGIYIKSGLYDISDVLEYIYIFFYYLAVINVGLGIFNLIPIPPLDGSKVLGAILPEKLYFNYMRYEKYFALILIVLLWLGWLSGPINILNDIVLDGIWKLICLILRI